MKIISAVNQGVDFPFIPMEDDLYTNTPEENKEINENLLGAFLFGMTRK